MNKSEYLSNLQNTYFGWFIKNSRISFTIIALLVIYGWYAMFTIPKESSPDIKFGIVSVVTVYAWASPVDIDSQITTKIENEIKNLEGIDKISSKSSLWVSAIVITLKNWTNTQNFINETKTKTDNVILPTDAKKPVVTELSTANETLFKLILFGPTENFTMNQMRSLAMDFKKDIKWKGGILDVKIDGISSDSDYNVSVLLDKAKVENFGLTVWQIVWQIRAYNNSSPLGNHSLGNLNYDYRISNDLKSLSDLEKVPIKLTNGYIYLSDISSIQRKYKSESYNYGWVYKDGNNYAIWITIQKAKWVNIFDIAPKARQIIVQTLKKVKYAWVNMQYTLDGADDIVDNYSNLWDSWVQSILLVLLITALFIWFRQSIIAVLLMILSFFITFIVLKSFWLTMNFLTNFSLIIAFGSGVDTVIVFIQAAYENMKLGFNPKNAILIAIKTYQSANINTSLINICVFLPLFSLPGTLGKFLSFIPITIFATLLASLILSLTINGTVFAALNKPLKYYYDNEGDGEFIMSPEEKWVLDEDRIGKIPHSQYISMISNQKVSVFGYIINFFANIWQKIFEAVERWLTVVQNIYISWLRKLIRDRRYRILWIVWPVVLVILSFVFLAKSIWFKIFPSGDNANVNISVKWKEWTSTEYMNNIWSWLSNYISTITWVKSYNIIINNNEINLAIYLVKKKDRKLDSFTILNQINSGLDYLNLQWFSVQGKVQAWWPPADKPLGIKLVANDVKELSKLKLVANDFEKYLKSLTWSTNVNNSSTESPWQFEYVFDSDKLSQLWLTPSDIQSELYIAINGSNAWSITVENIDRDIIVKLNKFDDKITPELISNTIINTRAWPINIWSIATVKVAKAVNNISRLDTDVIMTVDADTLDWAPSDLQSKLMAYADNYDFPTGISQKAGWENAANAELLQAIAISFMIALFLAFIILVYQFNSFSLTLIVMYSIITAMLGVNIWLYITNNPYSMSVIIWFISMIWLVISTAIFLVDRIVYNLEHSDDLGRSIIEAWTVRFKPIIISHMSTILGTLSVVTLDAFYAGLWWTIVSWLIFGMVITLMSVPALVYSIKAPKNSTKS